jgi:hypothetical protein
MRRCLLALTGLALLALTGPARPGETPPAKTAAANSDAPVVLTLHNGSVLKPTVLLQAVEMDTKLGKLSIPAREVRNIDFGFRLSADDEAKVSQALRDLGNSRFAAREAATQTLTKMGRKAYPALVAARKGADLETTRRIETILKNIRARTPPDRLRTRKTDIVRTTDSTVAGHILAASFRMRYDLFGEVKVPLAEVRDLHSLLPGGDRIFLVDAAKYGTMTTWLETDFEVQLGNRLEITATGELNLDPMNRINNQFCRNVKPDGTPQLVSGEGHQPGQLLGRIGTDGPIFLVGSHYNGFPNRDGKLYLRIVTIWHANTIQAEGTYRVKVTSQAG